MSREDSNLKKFAFHIVDIIDEEKLYVDNIKQVLLNPDEELNRLNERLMWNLKILQKKIAQYKTEQTIINYQSSMKKLLDLEPKDLRHDLTVLALSTANSNFEIVKKFLLKVLNNTKISINSENSYGKVIGQLSQQLYKDPKLQKQFRKDMMNDFRNRVAHEDWHYNEKQEFTFKDENDTTISWDNKTLSTHIANFSMSMRYLTEAFFFKFCK